MLEQNKKKTPAMKKCATNAKGGAISVAKETFISTRTTFFA